MNLNEWEGRGHGVISGNMPGAVWSYQGKPSSNKSVLTVPRQIFKFKNARIRSDLPSKSNTRFTNSKPSGYYTYHQV
jgi:hypothetical protein